MICPQCHTEIGPLHRDGGEPDCPICIRAAFDPATKHAAALAALETALDAATEHHYQRDPGEAFTECHLCKTWEGHTDECPIPAIEAFMNAGQPEPRPRPRPPARPRVTTDEDAANARPGFEPPPAAAPAGAPPGPAEAPPRAATLRSRDKGSALLAALELRAALAIELNGGATLTASAIVTACASPDRHVRALAIGVAERRGIQVVHG